MIRLNLFLWLTQLIIIVFFWRFLPPELPLFYSRPWGKEQLIKNPLIFILPALSLLIFLLNLGLTRFLPESEKLAASILKNTALIFNLLCLISLIQIIKLFV